MGKIPVVCQRNGAIVDLTAANGKVGEFLSRLDGAGAKSPEIDFLTHDLSKDALRRMVAYGLAGAPKEMTPLSKVRELLGPYCILPHEVSSVMPHGYTSVEGLAFEVVPFSERLLNELSGHGILFPGTPLEALRLGDYAALSAGAASYCKITESGYCMGVRWHLFSRGPYRESTGAENWSSVGKTRAEQIGGICFPTGEKRAAPLVELVYLDTLMRRLRDQSILGVAGADKLRCQSSFTADRWNAVICPSQPDLILHEEDEKLQIFFSGDDNDEKADGLGLAVEYLPAY